MSWTGSNNTWKLESKYKVEKSEKKVICELKIPDTRNLSSSCLSKYEEIGKRPELLSEVETDALLNICYETYVMKHPYAVFKKCYLFCVDFYNYVLYVK